MHTRIVLDDYWGHNIHLLETRKNLDTPKIFFFCEIRQKVASDKHTHTRSLHTLSLSVPLEDTDYETNKRSD